MNTNFPRAPRSSPRLWNLPPRRTDSASFEHNAAAFPTLSRLSRGCFDGGKGCSDPRLAYKRRIRFQCCHTIPLTPLPPPAPLLQQTPKIFPRSYTRAYIYLGAYIPTTSSLFRICTLRNTPSLPLFALSIPEVIEHLTLSLSPRTNFIHKDRSSPASSSSYHREQLISRFLIILHPTNSTMNPSTFSRKTFCPSQRCFSTLLLWNCSPFFLLKGCCDSKNARSTRRG